MKTTIKEKQIKFLDDTVAYYNSYNRCISNGDCFYSPKSVNDPLVPQGCAIGRHLSARMAFTFDKEDASGVSDVFDRLPNKLKYLGMGFLVDVQNLHDVCSCWNDSGLSDIGEETYKAILNRL